MTNLEIVNELLKNSKNEEMIYILNKYLNCEEYDLSLMRLNNCINYIEQVNFDITDWMLFDIPIFYSHCFWNTKTKQAFDLVVWDISEVIPRYLDENFNEQDAITIEESINKYCIDDYINSDR